MTIKEANELKYSVSIIKDMINNGKHKELDGMPSTYDEWSKGWDSCLETLFGIEIEKAKAKLEKLGCKKWHKLGSEQCIGKLTIIDEVNGEMEDCSEYHLCQDCQAEKEIYEEILR